MSVPISEKGYATDPYRRFWRVPEDHEDSPDLHWPDNIDVYDKMRRQDAQIMSVLRAVTLPILRTSWRIDGTGCPDQVTEHIADNLGLRIKGREDRRVTRSRNRFSWPSHLRLAMLQLVFGHSFFEQVYRIDAGRVHLRKLAWRPPRTISKIDIAADGGLVAIEQQASLSGTKPVRIPVEDLVVYVNEREGGNWLGRSLLRPAYKFWLLKDRALMTQSLTIDRNGLGVPVYKGGDLPEGLTGEAAKQHQADEMQRGLKVAQELRSGENAGASVPKGGDIVLQGVTGTLPDADKPIRYYDEQIARAVLAHFLNLGTETGSWALGSTFADFFTMSLQAVAEDIADVTQQHVIEDLVDLNWGTDTPAPRLVFDEIGSKHPITAEAIRALLSSGAITPDDALEAFLRDAFDMPAPDPATRREVPKQTPSQEPRNG